MKHTEQDAMRIAKEYKKRYSLKNEIKRAQFNSQFDVEGDNAWIVTGESVLFDEIREFYYVISDKTGKVEYTFNEYGSTNPHIDVEINDKEFLKEWEDYEKENPEDFV